MTAKQWLSECRNLSRRVARECDYIARLRAQAEGITGRLDPNRGSGRSSRDASGVIDHLIDIERQAVGLLNECQARLAVAQPAIEALTDPRERELLRYRYIHNLDWQQIADCMHCDRKTAWRIHGYALRNFRVPDDESRPTMSH